MKNEEHINELFKKYLNDSYSEKELDELLEYFQLSEHVEELKARIEEELFSIYGFDQYKEGIEAVDQLVREAIFHKIQVLPKRNISYLRASIAIAASLLLVISLTYYWGKRMEFDEDVLVQKNVVDFLPGTNKATLQFDNGQAIILREDRKGIRMDEDQIIYNDGTKVTSSSETQFATLTVPRAGQYQAILPDGTKVWLNAETVLKYPTSFNGRTREIEMVGEAYFEVAHNPQQPFIVKSNKQSVQVLGTAFNINTTTANAITTLLEGSVQLREGDRYSTKLLPGEQAIASTAGFVVKKVNVDNYVAWKDGLIILNKQNIHDILNQLERWYDVEFVNSNTINSNIELSGEIPRDVNLSGILQALEQQVNINFKIEGRRIIINQ